MIFSMTGFAAQQCEIATGVLAIELRSVNHRYLELHLRMDENLRVFEPQLREAISNRLGRGKVECRLALHAKEGELVGEELNHPVLARLVKLEREVRHYFPDSPSLSVAEILRWPGVIAVEPITSDILAAEITGLLERAIGELADSRAREGEKLKALILERVAQIELLVEKVRPLLPALLQAYQEKLGARLREAMQAADDERVRQELVIFAQKIDVDEELSRLVTHLQEIRRILAAGGAVGKRLDFLMQELHREANTLGSKSVATETSQVSMELKVLIEQMREQVQNLE